MWKIVNLSNFDGPAIRNVNRGDTLAVLDGVPPTGLQLLRSERVLLTRWFWSTWQSEVKLSPPRGPPEELYEIRTHRFARIDSQEKNPIFMMFERFPRIAAKLRIEVF